MRLKSPRTTKLLLMLALAAPASSWADDGAEGYTLKLVGGGDWIAAVKDDADPNQPGALLIAPTRALPEVGSNPGIAIGGFVEVGRGRAFVGADYRTRAPVASVNAAPVWCGGITALMGAAGLADDCVAQQGPARLPELSRSQLTMGYALDGADVRLVYGDTAAARDGAGDWLIVPETIGVAGDPNAIGFALPGIVGAVPSRDITLSGSLPLGRFGDLTLAAGYAQANVQGGFGRASSTNAFPIAPLDQTALRVGMRRGAFAGAITGRVVRADSDANANTWTGLDLGISWRTPWAGEISFGAENLLGRGNTALLPTPPATTRDDDSAARTPYVRYRQDL